MRIAFVGKGGSGKTTFSALSAKLLSKTGKKVLAFDADINQFLARKLGIANENAQKVPALSDNLDLLKKFLWHENHRIASVAEFIKTTPPGLGSRFVELEGDAEFLKKFFFSYGDILIGRAGDLSSTDIGLACYHSKTGSLEVLLNYLKDKEDEFVITDMTAGADSFASGLFTKFDTTYVVVRPSEDSVSVYEQYVSSASGYDVKIKVVGNYIKDEDDVRYLLDKIGADNIAAFIPESDYINKLSRGNYQEISHLEPNVSSMILSLFEPHNVTKACRVKMHEQAKVFHERNCLSWANSLYGKKLEDQIDPSFKLE
jgi:CO dehydrogenase maturation factor